MSEPVRVLHVLTEMNLGGAESRIMDLYRHMDTHQIQFDFVVHMKKPGYFDREIRERGGRIFIWPRLSPFNILRYIRTADKFFQEHPEYGILHGHLISYGILYHWIAKKNGVRIRIVHARSSASEKNFRGFLTSLMVRPLKYFATHYFACSMPAAEYVFGKKNLQNGKVRIINNAIDASKFRFSLEDRNRIRKEMALENRWVVGHVGKFRYAKNHPFLLEIFKEISRKNKEAVLLLVGDGPMKEAMVNRASVLGISDKVLFAGERSDIPAMLSAMDVFVFPSHYEGLPGSVIEAQASGLRCFISSAISREAGITDLAAFISLEEPAAAWSEKILTARHDSRQDMTKVIADAGFDAKTVAADLQEFYLRAAKPDEKEVL
jgi:glycosyltransferase involved in cell wall biosynthesis